MPFEACRPVRGFPSYKGQRHYNGRWWTATTGTLVGFESWLEGDRLIVLDVDPQVVGIASQPFWLFFTTAEGKRPTVRATLRVFGPTVRVATVR